MSKIDDFICSYLGLDREDSRPKQVQWIGRRLMVTHTSSFKRHAMKSQWEDYSQLELKSNSHEDKEKLGQATGKAIANQLVVSFSEPTIRMNQDA